MKRLILLPLLGINPAAQAATQTAASAPAATTSLLQISLSLTGILLLIFGLAWLARRYLPLPVRQGAAIRIVGGVSVGNRERVVLLEIGEQWVMVGVAPGRVNLLTTLPRQEMQTTPASPQSSFGAAFAAQLNKLRGQ